ncbi:MAG: SGNH/GDSL hydrolase family protein [Myxococcota bacterium]|nr:SGNH/GDSL hydrolase family protein [Myxococcota bacterium]
MGKFISKRKLFAFRLLVVIISLAFVLGIGEIAFRILRPVDLGTSHMHRIPHAERGWALEPEARYINQVGPILVPVEYSSEGWRDIDHVLPKPLHESRIVVLGDSFMEGYSVRSEETMTRRLESLLREQGQPETRAVNLGVGGYGTLQELITYRTVGARHEPFLVLLGFYENDLWNNLPGLDSDGLKLQTRPFLLDGPGFRISTIDYEGALERFEANRIAAENDFFMRMKRNSALAQRIDDAKAYVGSQIETAFALGQAAWSRGRGAIDSSAEAERLKSRKASADRCADRVTRAWSTTERILAQLDEEVEAHGGKLIVFSVPAIRGIPFSEVGLSPSQTAGNCSRDAAPSQLAVVTQRLGIDFIDLFPAFHTRSDGDPEALFHAADLHWNAAGHNLAASVIADELTDTLAAIRAGRGIEAEGSSSSP